MDRPQPGYYSGTSGIGTMAYESMKRMCPTKLKVKSEAKHVDSKHGVSVRELGLGLIR